MKKRTSQQAAADVQECKEHVAMSKLLNFKRYLYRVLDELGQRYYFKMNNSERARFREVSAIYFTFIEPLIYIDLECLREMSDLLKKYKNSDLL